MVLGHLDTVYPLGTLAKMPFRVARGRAWGPGTFDMKGGLVLALFAVDALRALEIQPKKRFVFLWTSDEEIGSESSRRAIEREARRSDAVLVLEPSFGRAGRLKTQRKGVGGAEILVTGHSAHAGIDPEKGVNAVHELALQITRLMKMNDPRRGITVQTTVVSGGTITNVVPEHARAMVDIRYARAADVPRINRKLHSLRPTLKGARVEVRGGADRPPLERTAAVRKLFGVAQSLMQEMGLPLGEASTGGGSDGSFTAVLGVPTLDGLGAVGDGAHSPREHVLTSKLPERAALIAGLLATL
jgi:glutamate carboxypeptidase